MKLYITRILLIANVLLCGKDVVKAAGESPYVSAQSGAGYFALSVKGNPVPL